jgi:hypothetical protein
VPASWKALYESQAVGVWLLVALPALFLLRLATQGFATGPAVEPYAARLVRLWTVVFAVVAAVDPIATGILGWPMLPFVLLGDYRVFALVMVVMQPGRSLAMALLEAAAWTLIVPVIAYATTQALGAIAGPLPPVALWIAYQTAFALLALGMIARLVPARVGIERLPVRRYLRAVLGFVVAYYVLWTAADVIVLRGYEWGWGLRVVPNLLYYGVFVPFAYWRFFAARNAASSTSVQTAR